MTSNFNVIANSEEATLRLESAKLSINTTKSNRSMIFTPGQIEQAEFFISGPHLTIQLFTTSTQNSFVSIAKLKPDDQTEIYNYLKNQFNITPNTQKTVISGGNSGEITFGAKSFSLTQNSEPIITVPYSSIDQAQAPTLNDLNLAIDVPSTAEGHSLSYIRIFVPSDAAVNSKDLLTDINNRTDLTAGSETYLAEIKDVSFITPNYTYSMRFCEDLLFLYGESVSYRIPYRDISNVHRFPVPTPNKNGVNQEHVVISLKRPIRKGQTPYQTLVITTTDDEEFEATGIESSDDTLANCIENLLKRVGNVHTTPNNDSFYSNVDGENAIKCSFKNKEGLLYITPEFFFFLPRSVQCIPFNNIRQVEFKRIDEATNRRNHSFDIVLHESNDRSHQFSNVEGCGVFGAKEEKDKQRANFVELQSIMSYLDNKNIKIADRKKLHSTIKKILNANKGANVRPARVQAELQTAAELRDLGSSSGDENEEEDHDWNEKPSASESSSTADELPAEEEDKEDDKAPANDDESSD